MVNEEEERYFRQLDAEKREALRKKMAKEGADLEERRRIAASTGAEMSVVDRIAALGFSGDSARIFDLMPLVAVAWADGKIQKGERAKILGLLEGRGIEEGSDAFNTMASMLEQRPDETFMRETMDALRDVVGDEHDKTQGIVNLCIEVAAASGGLLGLGIGATVGDDERQRIGEIAATLGVDAADAVTKQFE
ncbi:MAG: hypothetical protein AAF721_02185 [Myxococcota bacterium]